MKILYIANGSGLGTAKSGGMTRNIEISKRLLKKGVMISYLTTSGSHVNYLEEGLKATFYLARASLFYSKERNQFDRFISYVISTIHSLFMILKLPSFDILYSTSDYFCDVVPSFFYKLRFRKSIWIAMIHHLCRSPLKRKGNFFTNLFSYFSQRLSFVLIAFLADAVFVYNTPEGKNISSFFPSLNKKHQIYFVNNGIDINTINKVPKGKVKFDACFVGGLRASKGIFDIVKIWKLVKQSNQNATLAIAGGGTPEILKSLTNIIVNEGLENNIVLLGPLKQNKMYQLMKSSKIFVSTSHEEGWGIALCEALACRLPAVAYKLPAFKIYSSAILMVDIEDYKAFAKNIFGLLSNGKQRQCLAKRGSELVQQYEWESIANSEMNYYRGLYLYASKQK